MTPLIGEALAIDLVNTRVEDPRLGEVDFLAAESDLRSWLAQQASAAAPVPTEGVDLGAVLELRSELDVFFDAALNQRTPPARVLRRIGERAAAAPRTPSLAWTDDHLVVRKARSGTPTEQLLAAVAESVADLVADGDLAKLRVCAADTCRLIFVARRRRQWCSPNTCGNRARVARHYQRHHAGG